MDRNKNTVNITFTDTKELTFKLDAAKKFILVITY